MSDRPEKSAYRSKVWPAVPAGIIGPEWGRVNDFRRAKFSHHVVAPFENEVLAWCEDQFGEQAIANIRMVEDCYWTRGIWTYLGHRDEGVITLMFIERGMAAAARLRWG